MYSIRWTSIGGGGLSRVTTVVQRPDRGRVTRRAQRVPPPTGVVRSVAFDDVGAVA